MTATAVLALSGCGKGVTDPSPQRLAELVSERAGQTKVQFLLGRPDRKAAGRKQRALWTYRYPASGEVAIVQVAFRNGKVDRVCALSPEQVRMASKTPCRRWAKIK